MSFVSIKVANEKSAFDHMVLTVSIFHPVTPITLIIYIIKICESAETIELVVLVQEIPNVEGFIKELEVAMLKVTLVKFSKEGRFDSFNTCRQILVIKVELTLSVRRA